MENEQFVIGAIMAKDPEELTQDEQNILAEWLSHDGNQEIYDRATSEENKLEGIIRLYELSGDNDRCLQKFNSTVRIIPIAAPEKKTINLWKGWSQYIVAASFILAVSVGVYLWNKNRNNNAVVTNVVQPETIQNDADPGKFKAKLILADGSSVVLDSAAAGTLAQQGNMTVVNEDGRLVYKDQGHVVQGQEGAAVLYNKLVTAKGETFATVLSDGSKVWLNSESSISYPVTFAGEERKVTITGEAYFEVARNAKKPFIVAGDPLPSGGPGWAVEVLGTHFNINAYNNEEAINTTLLEGKVKIVSGGTSAVLKPGQQAQLKKGTTLLQVMDNADLEQAVAWKNGYFQFNDDHLRVVMRQLERWYDVEVVYEGNISADTFWGKIKRNSKASEVLSLLEQNQVHFKIQGKKIIVTR